MTDAPNKSNAIVLTNGTSGESSVLSDAAGAAQTLRSTALQNIETSLADDADDDQAAAFVSRWKAFKAAVREIDQAMQASVLGRLVRTGRDLQVGEVRYYAGTDTEVVCRDVTAATDKLLQATGGAMGEFSATLVAQPYKPSVARQLLSPQDYELCFERRTKDKVKEGKSKSNVKLLSFNPKFSK